MKTREEQTEQKEKTRAGSQPSSAPVKEDRAAAIEQTLSSGCCCSKN